MKIIKAKVTKEKTLIAVYKNENDDTVTIEGKNIVHKDLEACFTELVPHLAFLCEQKEADGKQSFDELPDDILNTLEVSGFSIGGDGDSEGVTLTGKRFLKSKKVLNLNAPFTMFSNDNEEYNYSFELMESINACKYEVEQYLTAKKWAIVQQELPFDGDSQEPFADKIEEAVNNLADANVTLEINGKTIKPRSKRKVKETAA